MQVLRATKIHDQVSALLPDLDYITTEPMEGIIYSKQEVICRAYCHAAKCTNHVIVIETGVFLYEYVMYDICVILKKTDDVHEEIVFAPVKEKRNVIKEALQKIAEIL